MSLGDLNRQVNRAGQSTYNTAAARMMADKKARDKQLEMRELDRTKHEISHRKLEHMKVQTQIQKLRRELIHLKNGGRNTQSLDLIRRLESELRTLESESRTIDSDIRMKTLEVQRHGGLSF